jgi:PhnB protein
VHDAAAAIAFYEKSFGAKVEGEPSRGKDGKVLHSELLLGGMKFFVNDEFPEMGAYGAVHYGGSPVHLQLRVKDVDAAYNAAVANGAKSMMKPEDAFWGDRYACVTDPFGHVWGISAPNEDLSEAEQKERTDKWMREQESSKK